MKNLRSAKRIKMPKEIGGHIYIPNKPEFYGLTRPEKMGGSFIHP